MDEYEQVILRSYLFLYLGLVGKGIQDFLFFLHFANDFSIFITLIVIVFSPIFGFILGWKDSKSGAMALNFIFFIIFSLLATVNLWIYTFGK
jgi:hypothetical protein